MADPLEADDILQTVDNFLQAADSNLRQQAARKIENYRRYYNQTIINTYISILTNHSSLQYRKFSIGELRSLLHFFLYSSSERYKLRFDLEQSFLLNLFSAISKEQDQQIKIMIGKALEEIALRWRPKHDQIQFHKKFVQMLIILMNSSSDLVLTLVGNLYKYIPEYLNNIYGVTKMYLNITLQSQSPKINLLAIQIFLIQLKFYFSSDGANLNQLSSLFFKVLYLLVNQRNEYDIFNEFLSCIENDKFYFFKDYYQQMIKTLIDVFFLPKSSKQIRFNIVSTLVQFSCDSYSLELDNHALLEKIIQMVFYCMIDLRQQISQRWMQLQRGLIKQDKQQQENIKFGMKSIDMFLKSFCRSSFKDVLFETCKKFMKHSDNRYSFCALMALSQVGDYTDVQEITEMLSKIMGFLKHSNPKLRYAACHAIGLIAEYKSPKLQQQMSESIIIYLISTMLHDPVPKVVSQSAAALTNYIQGMGYDQIASQQNILMNVLQDKAENGQQIVKKTTLGAINSTVVIMKYHFEPYLDRTLQILFEYFKLQYEGKEIKENALEVIMTIIESTNSSIFRPSLERFMQIISISLKSWTHETGVNPVKIMKVWSDLCLIYGRQISKYFESIHVDMLAMIQKIVSNNQASSSQTSKEYYENIVQSAIEMLKDLIYQFTERYTPFARQIFTLLRTFFRNDSSPKIKQGVYNCLYELILTVFETNPEEAKILIHHFKMQISDSIKDKRSLNIRRLDLENFSKIMNTVGFCFLTDIQIRQYLDEFLDFFIEVYDKIMDKSQQIWKYGKCASIHQLQVVFFKVIETLSKTHKAEIVAFFIYRIINFLILLFDQNSKQDYLKFGLCLINYMVENIGYSKLYLRWQYFSSILLINLSGSNIQLRQLSSQGIGLYAEQTPSTIVCQQIILTWLEALTEQYNCLKKTYECCFHAAYCCDTVISAIGKIIKTHPRMFDSAPYVQLWLSNLPLRFNEKEASIQYELMIDLLLIRPSLLKYCESVDMERIISIMTNIDVQNYNPSAYRKMNLNLHEMSFERYEDAIESKLRQWQEKMLVQLKK